MRAMGLPCGFISTDYIEAVAAQQEQQAAAEYAARLQAIQDHYAHEQSPPQ